MRNKEKCLVDYKNRLNKMSHTELYKATYGMSREELIEDILERAEDDPDFESDYEFEDKWKGVMSNKECECILTYKLGSCAIDALHDLTEEQQGLLVAHCRDDWGQEYINEMVKHVESGFSLHTDPDYNPSKGE